MRKRTIVLNRLWNNLASVRDYIVEDLVKTGTTLELKVKGSDEAMILTPEEMKSKKFQISTKKIESRYGTGAYTLVDFAWRPNKTPQETALSLPVNPVKSEQQSLFD